MAVTTVDLLRALEFSHYAERFRDKIFVVALPAESSFQDWLPDFKVLASYRIRIILVLPDPSFLLDGLIADSNKRGTRFQLSLFTEPAFDPQKGPPRLDYSRLRSALADGLTPLIAYRPDPGGSTGALPFPALPEPALPEPALLLAGEVAVSMEADKLFVAGVQIKPLLKAAARSHILAEELSALLESLEPAIKPGFSPYFNFIEAMLKRGIPDVMLMAGQPGELYQEVFTHDGAGIMFNRMQHSLIRRARIEDTTDIALLIRPEFESGRLLPVEESQIEIDIALYWVYEIDGLLAGLARLRGYGDWAEMAQFATLPRYRGKGRARELALKLLEEAKGGGYRRVFALSLDERMWEFFSSLNFSEIERRELPEEWRRSYDLDRPSRAFVKEFQ